MDTSIAGFFNREKRHIDKIIDQTFFRLMESTSPIDKYMPITNYVNRKLLLLKLVKHKPTIGSIVAEEQEIPAQRPRATLDETILSSLKIGKKIVFTARHFEMMHEMMRYTSESGPLGAQVATEIKKSFFGMAADLVPAIVEKHTMLTFQVAATGACQFTDPLTGARVDFSYPDTDPNLLPNELTGAAAWSNPTTCSPLINLELHARAYYDRLGYWPPTVIMHFDQLRQIADSSEAKIAYLRKIGADSATPAVDGIYLSDEMVMDMIKMRTRSQMVMLFDAMYSEEQENGSIVDKFFLPTGTYLFAKEGYLERAFVPTVEKDFQAGIYFHSKVVEESPRVERSVACGNGIPLNADGRLIAARKVA